MMDQYFSDSVWLSFIMNLTATSSTNLTTFRVRMLISWALCTCDMNETCASISVFRLIQRTTKWTRWHWVSWSYRRAVRFSFTAFKIDFNNVGAWHVGASANLQHTLALPTMPQQFQGASNMTFNHGSFIDVGRDYNHTDNSYRPQNSHNGNFNLGTGNGTSRGNDIAIGTNAAKSSPWANEQAEPACRYIDLLRFYDTLSSGYV